MYKIKKWLDNFLKNRRSRPAKGSNLVKNKNGKKYALKDFFIRKKRRSNFALSVFVTTLRLFLILFILVGFVGFGAVIGIGKAYLDSTPELDVMQIQEQSETSFIYDRYGNLVTEYYGFENRIWAPFREIPENLKNAFIAIEDVRFRVHNGIDIKRIFGSIIHNIGNETVQGASTLTQQLLKNTILTPEVSYRRKIQEMYLAIQLEKKYSKDQIMEAYLNTIWLGGSNYGVKAAAKDYFGKELGELTLRECAMLAGITQNPWQYDPRANTYTRDNPASTYKRTNLVIDRMYENGLIDQAQYEMAKIDESEFDDHPVYIAKTPTSNDYPMKYFIEYVIKDLRDRIMVLEGWEGEEGRKKADQYIYSGGLHIYTTLDPKIQETVEEEIYNYKTLPRFANSAHKLSKQGVEQPQAAAVVIDQNTGELRAIVGGKQPPSGKRQYNRAFHPDAKLPLGSCMKPLAVYGPFIEAGYPGGIIVENIPAPIDGWKGGELPYPRNYGDTKYDGPSDVRKGIKNSLNVVAARIVVDRIGVQYSAEKLIELGLNPKDVPAEPAALSLGTHGNNMIEISGAFATIANKGIYQEPISFTKVVDKNGNEVINPQKRQTTREVFKESTTFILTDWMKDVITGGTAQVQVKNKKGQRIIAAGKTGTNSEFRGVFFAGFTPYYTTTIWFGHDDFQPPFVVNTTGGRYAAPLWQSIMNKIHVDLEPKEFYDQVPDDVVKLTVCGVSGKRPNGDLCKDHKLITEWFPVDAVPGPEDVCDMHVQIEACPYSGKPPTPYCPENHQVKTSAILLPKDSPYRLLTEQELKKYLPGAIDNLDRVASLDYDSPNDRQFFCNLHTEEWYRAEQQREIRTSQASTLIAQVRNNMVNPLYKPRLTQARLSKINKAIDELEASLKNGIIEMPSEPSQGNKPIPAPTIFNAELVDTKIRKLKEINVDIFGSPQD